MSKGYIFEYKNENEFKKLEKSVKKYNMRAYKKLLFEYYDELKDGKFLGRVVSTNSKEKSSTYELVLPTDDLFTKVHGEISLHYTVFKEKNFILLETISPEEILLEGHFSELTTYKGVMVSKKHSQKDMFKINLLNVLERLD